ncbi:hypothetical protein [Marinoscillum luteum]|uniref:Uncharacterized protein n=1 Tax=Marinoscillum luteum TaxID=861051 RepID=A0ABW7N9X8_9BACT
MVIWLFWVMLWWVCGGCAYQVLLCVIVGLMQRIYFDWNIFSSLKQLKEKSEPYKTIFSIINKNKDKLIFPYSPAHLNDLNRSFNKSEKAKKLTYDDLDFLGNLSGNLCFCEDYKTKTVSPMVRSPRDYFDEQQEQQGIDYFDFENLFLEEDDPAIQKMWQALISLLKSMPSGIDLTQINELPPEYKKVQDLFELTKKENNFLNFMKDISKVLRNPGEYSDVYRYSTNASIKQMKVDTNPENWGDPFDYLDNVLAKAKVGKTFREMMDSTLKQTSKGKPGSRFDHFVNYYISLDTFGFHRDSKLPNLIDDATHSYYGAYCDYFVSNDKRTCAKAKAVYEQMNISTKVCDAKTFPSEFYKLNYIQKDTAKSIFEEIAEVIENSLILLNTVDDELNPSSVHKIDQPVLGFFDRLQITDYGDKLAIYLYKKKSNYSNFMFWIELESLVNKVVAELGVDNQNRDRFCEEDREELNNQNWKGRTWGNQDKFMSLFYGDEPFGFSLQYQVKRNN